jgi:hypothetical protein
MDIWNNRLYVRLIEYQRWDDIIIQEPWSIYGEPQHYDINVYKITKKRYYFTPQRDKRKTQDREHIDKYYTTNIDEAI